jgi:hypothetical protein
MTALGIALAARIRVRRRLDTWRHPALAGKHLISMSRLHAGGDVYSVATCQCRWRSRVELSEIADQEAAIEGHRRDVIAAAIEVAA